jgi:hypothetical protein
MAKSRMINTKMWSDNWFINLDPVEKLLFIYLLTNERTNLCGLYELPIKIMSVETGIEKEMIENILKRLEKDSKVYSFDGWVLIRNFYKHQLQNPSITQGIIRVFDEIPDKVKQTATKLIPDWRILKLKPQPKLKPKLEPQDIVGSADKEWNYKSFLSGMEDHKRRDFQIMALYWDFKEIKFTNREQAMGEIKRLLRPAKELVAFEDDKIYKTMEWLKGNASFKWTLETVGKYINENLSKLKPL